MRVLIQRVSRAAVSVEGETVGSVGHGLLLLVGAASGDDAADIAYLAPKVANMRIFSDEAGRMNLSLLDTGGEALVVSQFTLLADVRRGRRPSFVGAAEPDAAADLVHEFVRQLRGLGVSVAEGRFGAMMEVELVNDGPVTIWLDSAELRR